MAILGHRANHGHGPQRGGVCGSLCGRSLQLGGWAQADRRTRSADARVTPEWGDGRRVGRSEPRGDGRQGVCGQSVYRWDQRS